MKLALMQTTRSERLEARLSSDQKRVLQRAADLRGSSLTEFVLNSAHEAAMRTIEEFEVLKLTERDRDVFIRALLHPPAPNQALRRAAKRLREAGK